MALFRADPTKRFRDKLTHDYEKLGTFKADYPNRGLTNAYIALNVKNAKDQQAEVVKQCTSDIITYQGTSVGSIVASHPVISDCSPNILGLLAYDKPITTKMDLMWHSLRTKAHLFIAFDASGLNHKRTQTHSIAWIFGHLVARLYNGQREKYHDHDTSHNDYNERLSQADKDLNVLGYAAELFKKQHVKVFADGIKALAELPLDVTFHSHTPGHELRLFEVDLACLFVDYIDGFRMDRLLRPGMHGEIDMFNFMELSRRLLRSYTGSHEELLPKLAKNIICSASERMTRTARYDGEGVEFGTTEDATHNHRYWECNFLVAATYHKLQGQISLDEDEIKRKEAIEKRARRAIVDIKGHFLAIKLSKKQLPHELDNCSSFQHMIRAFSIYVFMRAVPIIIGLKQQGLGEQRRLEPQVVLEADAEIDRLDLEFGTKPLPSERQTPYSAVLGAAHILMQLRAMQHGEAGFRAHKNSVLRRTEAQTNIK